MPKIPTLLSLAATPVAKATTGKANKAKAEKQIIVDEQMEEGGSDSKSSKQRYFKLIYNDEIQGRYSGKKT